MLKRKEDIEKFLHRNIELPMSMRKMVQVYFERYQDSHRKLVMYSTCKKVTDIPTPKTEPITNIMEECAAVDTGLPTVEHIVNQV